MDVYVIRMHGARCILHIYFYYVKIINSITTFPAHIFLVPFSSFISHYRMRVHTVLTQTATGTKVHDAAASTEMSEKKTQMKTEN